MNSAITSALLFLLSSYASATDPSFTACVADCTRGAGDDADVFKCMQNCPSPSKSVSNTHLRGASFVTPNESDTADDGKKPNSDKPLLEKNLEVLICDRQCRDSGLEGIDLIKCYNRCNKSDALLKEESNDHKKSNSDKPFLDKEDEKDDQPRSFCIKQCSESGLEGIKLVNCYNRCNKSDTLLKEEPNDDDTHATFRCLDECYQKSSELSKLFDCFDRCSTSVSLFLSSNESSTKDDDKKPGSDKPKSDKSKNDKPTGSKPNDKGDIPTLLCQQRCTQQGLQGNDLLNCLNNCNKNDVLLIEESNDDDDPFAIFVCLDECYQQSSGQSALLDCIDGCYTSVSLSISSKKSISKDDDKKPGSDKPKSDKSKSDKSKNDKPTGGKPNQKGDIPTLLCQQRCTQQGLQGNDLLNCLNNCNKVDTSFLSSEEHGANVKESNPFSEHCKLDCAEQGLKGRELASCQHNCDKSLADSEMVDVTAGEKSENVPEPFESQCEYDCYVFETTAYGLNTCLDKCYYPTEEESENVPEPFESQCEYDCYVFQTTKDGLNNCLKKCYYPAEEKSENVPEPFEIQ